jgi:serine/threonine protein kinase
MPPEMLVKGPDGKYIPNHSISVDIWSLGVVLYFLCFSSVPYMNVEDVDLLKEEIINFNPSLMTFPDTERIDPEYLFWIQKMLSVDAEKRPKVTEILQWIENAAFAGMTVTPVNSPTFVSAVVSPVDKQPISRRDLGLSKQLLVPLLLLPILPSLFFKEAQPVLTVLACLIPVFLIYNR